MIFFIIINIIVLNECFEQSIKPEQLFKKILWSFAKCLAFSLGDGYVKKESSGKTNS